ncbi:nodulation protein NfeD [Candidatus Omnitrophota bacterium]
MKQILFSLLLVVLAVGSTYAETESVREIDVLIIDNYSINPVIANFISEAIDTANKENRECLIIQLDTPGGLLESTRQIVKSILNSDVPVIVYIAPSGSRAGSAGVFITYASHIAAMAPSTHIGAAHPVGIGLPPTRQLEKEIDKKKNDAVPIEQPKDIMEEKIMNDVIAWITAIAEHRNRSVEWAKEAVQKSESLTQKEAKKQGVVDILADDMDDLLAQLDGRTVMVDDNQLSISTKDATINFLSPTLQERILNYVAHPQIASILLLLGTLGLIFEFTHPGIGFPGIAGLICLLLAFFALQLFPINYLGIVLIILAIVLFVAEAFTPTFGLLTLGGIISLVFGAMMLAKNAHPFFFYPSLKLIIPVALAIAGITVFLVSNAVKAHRRKVSTGSKGMVGQTAVTITKLRPKGKVSAHGEIWNAVSNSKKAVGKNQKVTIVEVNGLTLIVEKTKGGAA